MIQEWLLLGWEGSLVLVPTAWEQSSGTLASSTLEALYKSTNTNTNANTNTKTNTNTDKIPIQIKIKIPIQTPIQIQIQIQNRSAPYNLICCLIHREVDKYISTLNSSWVKLSWFTDNLWTFLFPDLHLHWQTTSSIVCLDQSWSSYTKSRKTPFDDHPARFQLDCKLNTVQMPDDR